MNRRGLVALGALSLAFVGALAGVGCISNANDAPPTGDSGSPPLFDSGPSPTFDATTPTDASADSSLGPTPDAGTDAAPGIVTIQVKNDVGPLAGRMVIFHDTSGAVLATATTDATGTVSQSLAPNSQVTVVFGTPDSLVLTTVQGVQPGDVLQMFDTTDLSYPRGTVDFDAIPDAATFSPTYLTPAVGDCDDFTNIVTSGLDGYDVEYPCDFQGVFPVLLRALDVDENEVAFTYQKGNVLPDDGGPAHVSIARPYSTNETKQTIRAVGVPPIQTLGNGYFTYTEITSNVAYALPANGIDSASVDDAGAYSLPIVGHPGYPDSVQSEVDLQYSLDASLAYTGIATHADPPDGSTTTTFDLSQALPELTSASVDTTTAGTPARPVISWTSAAPLSTVAAGILVGVYFNVTEPDGGSSSASWTVVAPPTSATVTPPAMPASLGTFVSATTWVPTVMAINATFMNGYAGLRSQVGAIPAPETLIGVSEAPIVPPLPYNGTLKLSVIFRQVDL